MKWKIAFLLTFLTHMSVFAEIPSTRAIHENKQAFIKKLVAENNFDQRQLQKLFASLQPNQEIIATMTQPFEKQPWGYYRNYFLTDRRVSLGAEYLKTHHKELAKIEKKYGIPSSIITAIIGVETEYGLHLGKYYVLDSLYTLGFYYPPREKFFRKELAEYLILARDNHLPYKSLKGSYAGALGIPQFMPSSYRIFGVSAKNNGSVNLFNNDDAIASVANYFYKNGWEANAPIAQQVKASASPVSVHTKIIKLPVKTGSEYWEMYPNFHVIMSYNHNVVYALAVYQLSQAIEKAYQDNETNSRA